MKPTEILMNEHRVIEQVLNVLEKMAHQSIGEGKLDKESAEQAIDFFKNFADRCHHGKEEVHLFPMMEARGFPREGGPTGVMFHEHELGRSYIKGMSEAIEPASQGDKEGLKQFAHHAQQYVQMLREHIQKEDHCLFAMANQAMNEEDQKTLHDLFEKVETEEMGDHTHEKFLQLANDLAQKYGVEKAQVDEKALHSCNHH